MSAGFAESVQAVLDATATDGAMLTLEMTERVLVHDEQRAIMVLGHLKEIGVKLAQSIVPGGGPAGRSWKAHARPKRRRGISGAGPERYSRWPAVGTAGGCEGD